MSSSLSIHAVDWDELVIALNTFSSAEFDKFIYSLPGDSFENDSTRKSSAFHYFVEKMNRRHGSTDFAKILHICDEFNDTAGNQFQPLVASAHNPQRLSGTDKGLNNTYYEVIDGVLNAAQVKELFEIAQKIELRALRPYLKSSHYNADDEDNYRGYEGTFEEWLWFCEYAREGFLILRWLVEQNKGALITTV